MLPKTISELKEKYLRQDLLPTIFCPGCGNGQILHYVVKAIDDLNISQDNLVFVSGIGCSSRLPAYLEAYGVHTTHGRAIAYATGIKITNPKLNVIVFTGDGDIAAIGLNHFLQAVRRNISITVICINNENYGMTGGQVSPTMRMGDYSKTTPYQNIEHSFNLSFLAKAAGAVYVARWTTAYSMEIIKSIKKGLRKRGLAFIEIFSQCPINKKQFKKPKDYIKNFLNETIRYTPDYNDSTSAHLFKNLNECFTAHYEGKIIVGEIVDLDKPDYHQLYNDLKMRANNEFWKKRRKK
ncbi:MAG: thiamine pyrophosphate-dependent enzyme [Promethearchaeota archaeon]